MNRAKEFEQQLAEQQRHLDWYAQEYQTSLNPAEEDMYRDRYYSLLKDRDTTRCRYLKHLRSEIARLKPMAVTGNKLTHRKRNQLKKAYFKLLHSA